MEYDWIWWQALFLHLRVYNLCELCISWLSCIFFSCLLTISKFSAFDLLSIETLLNFIVNHLESVDSCC